MFKICMPSESKKVLNEYIFGIFLPKAFHRLSIVILKQEQYPSKISTKVPILKIKKYFLNVMENI